MPMYDLKDMPPLPQEYSAPELLELGPLRQMIRGAGTPSRADFSSQDNGIPNENDDTCLGDPSEDGNQLADDDCETYAPF